MRANFTKLTPFGRWLLVDRVLVPGWAAARLLNRWGFPARPLIGDCGGGGRKAKPVSGIVRRVRIGSQRKRPSFDGRAAVQVPVETLQRPSLDWEH